MAVIRIVPDLEAADIAATRDFYTSLLGLEVAMDMGWIATLVSPSDRTAQLSLQAGGDAEGSPALTIEVDDIDATYSKAQAAGVEIVRDIIDENWGVRRFFVEDPDGRVINVMSHIKAPDRSS